jgi:hypothetical protein
MDRLLTSGKNKVLRCHGRSRYPFWSGPVDVQPPASYRNPDLAGSSGQLLASSSSGSDKVDSNPIVRSVCAAYDSPMLPRTAGLLVLFTFLWASSAWFVCRAEQSQPVPPVRYHLGNDPNSGAHWADPNLGDSSWPIAQVGRWPIPAF